jgi:hypothetical protein
VQGVPSVSVGPPDAFGGFLWYPLEVQTVDENGAPIPEVKVEATLIPPDTNIEIPPPFSQSVWADKNTIYLGTFGRTISRCTSEKNGNCYLGLAPKGKFIAILAKKDGYAGSRTNIFFTETSVVVVLQKIH